MKKSSFSFGQPCGWIKLLGMHWMTQGVHYRLVPYAPYLMHWMTQGVHYRLDFITFSRLLGFDHADREAPWLSNIFAEGISKADLDAAEMYKPGAHLDFKNTQLKPFFYVPNNLICYTIDPKFGDSIHLCLDAPKILARFGANGGRFGVSDLMWNKIVDGSVDPHKYLPYAPYLMQIMEQVTGVQFSHSCVHAPVRAKHLGAPHAPPLSPAGDALPAGDVVSAIKPYCGFWC